MTGALSRATAQVLDGCARALGRASAVADDLAAFIAPRDARQRRREMAEQAREVRAGVTSVARRLRHAADIESLVQAPVRQVIAVLGALGPEELGLLHERESAARARAGVLDAIERELLRRV